MRLHAIGAGLMALVFAVPAFADQEPAPKAAKRVTKAMSKLKSYRVRTTVQGGMAQGADHKITQGRVNETYDCEVVGHLAHIRGSKEAYRLRAGKEGAGTIRDSGVWKAILGTPEGKVIERLFKRPEDHFAKMAKFKKLARWLPPEEQPAGSEAPETIDFGTDDEEGAEPEAPKKDAKKDAKTRTRKGKKSKSRAGEDEGPISHRFRIVGPASEAINEFTTIVNSGCLGGG